MLEQAEINLIAAENYLDRNAADISNMDRVHTVNTTFNKLFIYCSLKTIYNITVLQYKIVQY